MTVDRPPLPAAADCFAGRGEAAREDPGVVAHPTVPASSNDEARLMASDRRRAPPDVANLGIRDDDPSKRDSEEDADGTSAPTVDRSRRTSARLPDVVSRPAIS